MATSSTTLKKGETLGDTRGPSKKLPMLNAIEKRFEGGAQEFCEHILEIALTGGVEGSAVPTLIGECLKRVQPPLKQNGVIINIDIPDGAKPIEKMDAIFKAVATGQIALESGQILIGMIKDSEAIAESTDRLERLEKVEQLLAGNV
jgi:hypothetical protein